MRKKSQEHPISIKNRFGVKNSFFSFSLVTLLEGISFSFRLGGLFFVILPFFFFFLLTIVNFKPPFCYYTN